MVLNTLQIDPRRAWKGPWRWFHEEMLDCCLPIARVVEEGIVLDQVDSPTAQQSALPGDIPLQACIILYLSLSYPHPWLSHYMCSISKLARRTDDADK